jgi:hypothetical protein
VNVVIALIVRVTAKVTDMPTVQSVAPSVAHALQAHLYRARKKSTRGS